MKEGGSALRASLWRGVDKRLAEALQLLVSTIISVDDIYFHVHCSNMCDRKRLYTAHREAHNRFCR
jgi:hypothetical protein